MCLYIKTYKQGDFYFQTSMTVYAIEKGNYSFSVCILITYMLMKH